MRLYTGIKRLTLLSKLYKEYLSIILKSRMEYKASFFMYSTGIFLSSFSVFMGIFFMFQRFTNVKGFVYSEVLLCYGIFLMGYTLSEMFARGFDAFPNLVRGGEFDRILLRPRNIVFQVLVSRFEYGRVGRLLQAAVMLVYGIHKSGIRWTGMKVLAVGLMIFGGMCLFSAVFVLCASFSFFTLEGLEFINVFTNGAVEYGKYPFEVYGKRMLQIVTFVIPYALVQYYPLLYLLDRDTNTAYVFFPLLALWFMIPAYGMWRYGVRRYQSSGS